MFPKNHAIIVCRQLIVAFIIIFLLIDRLHLTDALPTYDRSNVASTDGILEAIPVYITKRVVVEKPVPVPEPVIIEKPYHVPISIEKIVHKPVPVPVLVPQVTCI